MLQHKIPYPGILGNDHNNIDCEITNGYISCKACYNGDNPVNVLFMVYFHAGAEYTIHIRGIRKINLKRRGKNEFN